MVSISRGLGPTNSFSDEVFTTDSGVIVLQVGLGNGKGGLQVTASESKNSERITLTHPQQNTSFVHGEDHTTQCLEIVLLPLDDHSTLNSVGGRGKWTRKGI